jgi:predicted ribosome quality control (RQC) complex YloA/Tae2 family protein
MIAVESMPSMTETLETFYMKRHMELKLKARAQSMRRTVASRIDQLKSKTFKLSDELVTSENADEYKMTGDLILANAYSIEKGMNKVTVHNYYEEGDSTIDIKLDVRLTPNENAQAYYKKYMKFKSARINIEKQLEETTEEIEYLENVLTSIDCSEDYQNIDEIIMELYESNIIRKRPAGRKKKQKPSPPLSYTTSTGFEVVAGKNNLQNDRLTLKESSKGDVWFHTKDIPGSHVILRSGGKEVDDVTIHEAAMISAWNSKGRNSSQVPVDYTLVKYVKKPSGAKPGKVIYTHNRTVYVTSSEEEIEKLKAK